MGPAPDTILARTSSDPAALAAAVQRDLPALDSSLPVFTAMTMAERIERSLDPPRAVAMFLVALGALGLTLAGVGLYAVVAFGVSRRSREIGIRMALGACTREVVWNVGRDVAGLLGAGAGIGMSLAAIVILAMRVLESGTRNCDLSPRVRSAGDGHHPGFPAGRRPGGGIPPRTARGTDESALRAATVVRGSPSGSPRGHPNRPPDLPCSLSPSLSFPSTARRTSFSGETTHRDEVKAMPQLSRANLADTVDLAFEQTVPRSLVHKRRLENVLLTDIRSCGDDRFVCAGHLPIAHRFFNEPGRSPRRDILFYTELGRQASLAVSHAFLGVSTEDVFIFEQSEAAVAEAAWTPASSTALEPAFVEIRVHELTRRRNNAVNRVVAEHIMTIGGEEVFRGTGAWTVQPAALFQRLRRMSAPRTAPGPHSNVAPFPAPVHVDGSRVSAEHVVISTPEYAAGTGTYAATLIVNETHPYFFDHPCDHVPGMLLLEACAQLATAAARTALAGPAPLGVASYEVNFAQFVECGIPTRLAARVDANRAVQVSISQQDVLSGTTTLTLAFPA